MIVRENKVSIAKNSSILIACALFVFSDVAYAAPENQLPEVMDLLGRGVEYIGAAVAIFGLVQLGLAIKDGSTGGGGQLAGAIAMMVGGAIVFAAGALFKGMGTI